MIIWIEIEDRNGKIVGKINSALYWEQKDRLSRAGTFSTAIPITEKKLSLIKDRSVLKCFGVEWGRTFSLGMGIVESFEISYEANNPISVKLSGGNALAELSYRVINKFDIFKYEVRTPTILFYDLGAFYNDVSEFLLKSTNSYLLVGEDETFNVIDFEILKENDYPCKINWGFYYDDGTTEVEGVINDAQNLNKRIGNFYSIIKEQIEISKQQASMIQNTVKNIATDYQLVADSPSQLVIAPDFPVWQEPDWGELESIYSLSNLRVINNRSLSWDRWKTLKVQDSTFSLVNSGSVTFERLKYWAPRELNGITKYWVRLDPEEQMGLVETRINVRARVPRFFYFSELLAFAPDNWSIDTSFSEGIMILITLIDETILSALVEIAERTGQSFRLALNGERKIQWLINNVDNGIVASNQLTTLTETHCFIKSLQASQDTRGLISRVYPYGAGTGDARITLKHTDRTPPASYVLDRELNYIANDVLEQNIIRIDHVESFKTVQATDKTSVNDRQIANELFDAAINYLQENDKIYRSYKLEVICNKQILPGDLIEIKYEDPTIESALGIINEKVTVLEVTRKCDSDGIFITNLQVANVPRWPVNDNDFIAISQQKNKRHQSYNQPFSIFNVR